MRLRRLDLTRYGKFTDYSIDFGEHVAATPDFHIIYGLNEAGKSTSLSAYIDLLFGIEERTTYGFLHQGKAMEIGACLEFGGQEHEFRRLKQRANSLQDVQGQPVNEALLSVPLAGLTRDTYRMMFSLDDQTLEEGGNAILASKGDLGELLFSASAGLSGVNSILEAAISEADGLYRKRARSTKIALLKQQIGELKAQCDEIDTQASTYRNLVSALEQATTAYDEVMEEFGAAKARNDQIARILRVYPLTLDYARGTARLAEFEDLPQPPAEWATTISDLIIEEARLQTRQAGLVQREQKACEEQSRIVVESRLLEMEDRLEELNEATSRYITAEEDLPKRQAALLEAKRRLDLILAKLGQSDIDDPKTLLVPVATLGILRDLISEQSGIEVALHTARQEHDAARQALEKEQRDRQALDGQGTRLDAGMSAALQSLLAQLHDGNLIAELRLAERAVSARRQNFSDITARLHPWSGDGDALCKIMPVATSLLEDWQQRANDLARRRARIMEHDRELASTLEEEEARWAALRSATDIMEDEAANAVLGARDAAWAQHLNMLDRESADHFEAQMRKNDAVIAARLNSARELEELRTLSARLATTRARRTRQQHLLQDVDDELQALKCEIRAQTPAEIKLDDQLERRASCRTHKGRSNSLNEHRNHPKTDSTFWSDALTPGSWLASIRQWMEAHAAALLAWEELRQSLRDAKEAHTALASIQGGLGAILTKVGIAVDGLDLAALRQAADTMLAAQTQMQARQLEADKRASDLEANLVSRKAAVDHATAKADLWQKRWLEALAGTWFSDQHNSIGAVREILDTVASLPDALRENADMQHRIAAMQADRKAFVHAIGQLYERLGDQFDASNPVSAAKALSLRHEETRRARAKQQEYEAILAALAAEREELEDKIALHEVRSRQLTEFFQLDTLAEAQKALEACGKRDELIKQQSRLEQQIVSDMQLPSLDAVLTSLADMNGPELQREQAQLQASLEDLDQRAKDLFANKARANDALNTIDGDDEVARLMAKRQTLFLEMEERALQYLRLKTGSLVVEHGIRAYRDKHRSAMMNRASEAFRLITRNEYSGLATRSDKERETLIGLSRHGGSRLASEMSKGTRFQLYLALRLAGYEEFAASRPSVPFIADDIMETFDEPRSEEVFRLFEQMAHVGQVIYLTHHRHLCEIAAQIVPSVKIHEIA